jgi:peroxiredoxin
MKRFFLLLILSLASSLVFAQGNYTVKGKFNNYTGKVYFSIGGKRDSLITKTGDFVFKGKTVKPENSFIFIPHKKMVSITPFWVDNGKTILELDSIPFKNSRFSGIDVKAKIFKSGKTHQTIDSATSYKRKIESLNISIEQKGQLIKAMVDSLLNSYPSSIISLSVLMTNSQFYNEKELQDIYNTLDSALARHDYAMAIKTKYLTTIDVEIGKKLPDFSQNDQFGKKVSLADFKGKYTLIDFWASWCIPCRNENPVVVEAYQKYKTNGFEILVVSLDSSKEAWIKAIKDDGLTWYHVSDLGGWNNIVSKTFKITSVPNNFLIDKDGVVIAKNLRGEELTKKLAEIFNSK